MIDKITYDIKQKDENINLGLIYESPTYMKRFLNNYETMKQIAINEGNTHIVNMFIDVENAIKKCKFNEKHSQRLRLWMLGYREFEIADELNVSRVLIHKSIKRYCIKIIEQLKG